MGCDQYAACVAPPLKPQKNPKAGLRSRGDGMLAFQRSSGRSNRVASHTIRKKQTRLKKPAKTREELEAAIRLEMEDICEWPTDLAISVVPHEDSWKVEIMTDGPQDADRCDMIQSIADRLRGQFDLKG